MSDEYKRALNEVDKLMINMRKPSVLYGGISNIILISHWIKGYTYCSTGIPDNIITFRGITYGIEHFRFSATEIKKNDTLRIVLDKLIKSGIQHDVPVHATRDKLLKSFNRVYNKHLGKCEAYRKNIGDGGRLIFVAECEGVSIRNNSIEVSPAYTNEFLSIIDKNRQFGPDIICFILKRSNGNFIYIHDIDELRNRKIKYDNYLIEVQSYNIAKSVKVNRIGGSIEVPKQSRYITFICIDNSIDLSDIQGIIINKPKNGICKLKVDGDSIEIKSKNRIICIEENDVKTLINKFYNSYGYAYMIDLKNKPDSKIVY